MHICMCLWCIYEIARACAHVHVCVWHMYKLECVCTHVCVCGAYMSLCGHVLKCMYELACAHVWLECRLLSLATFYFF